MTLLLLRPAQVELEVNAKSAPGDNDNTNVVWQDKLLGYTQTLLAKNETELTKIYPDIGTEGSLRYAGSYTHTHTHSPPRKSECPATHAVS